METQNALQCRVQVQQRRQVTDADPHHGIAIYRRGDWSDTLGRNRRHTACAFDSERGNTLVEEVIEAEAATVDAQQGRKGPSAEVSSN